MARPRTKARPEDQIEFRDPPGKANGGTSWSSLLTPLLKRPGEWAMIFTADNPEQASNTQGNLQGRKVKIPEPDHDWSFSSRDCEVFAIYRGKNPRTPKRRAGKRVRTR